MLYSKPKHQSNLPVQPVIVLAYRQMRKLILQYVKLDHILTKNVSNQIQLQKIQVKFQRALTLLSNKDYFSVKMRDFILK